MSTIEIIKDALAKLVTCQAKQTRNQSDSATAAAITKDLLYASFEFGQNNQTAADEDKLEIAQNIEQAIRNIKIGVSRTFYRIDHEEQIKAKTYLSGLQFLLEICSDRTQNGKLNTSKQLIESLFKLEAVSDVLSSVDDWRPLPTDEELPKIIGIPPCHSWWDHEREMQKTN